MFSASSAVMYQGSRSGGTPARIGRIWSAKNFSAPMDIDNSASAHQSRNLSFLSSKSRCISEPIRKVSGKLLITPASAQSCTKRRFAPVRRTIGERAYALVCVVVSVPAAGFVKWTKVAASSDYPNTCCVYIAQSDPWQPQKIPLRLDRSKVVGEHQVCRIHVASNGWEPIEIRRNPRNGFATPET